MALSVDIRKQRFCVKTLNQILEPLLLQPVGAPGYIRGHSSDAESFALDYLRSEVLSKYDDGLKNPLKEQTTWNRFFEAEQLCKETNARFSKPICDDVERDYSMVSILFSARRAIDKILGKLDLNEAADRMEFGPGATTRLTRRERFGGFKFSGQPEVTRNCVPLAAAAICQSPNWALEVSGFTDVQSVARALSVVVGNDVVKVPKSYKTDRTIAKEPCMNIYVQKGFGSVIRERLKRVGVDLRNQKTNQDLAREGSVTGALATVDLSMASDCLSTGLVYHLLPPEWFEILEQCRSRIGRLSSSKEMLLWEKFSSMGNGFTFELESLVFYAISCAVVGSFEGESERRVNVYGDDIIVPSYASQRLLEVLAFCGFRANENKTFSSGPFRESCGKHYYLGVDVSPFYIRRPLKVAEDVFLLHNNLLEWGARLMSNELTTLATSVCYKLREVINDVEWREPKLVVGHPERDACFHGFEFEVKRTRHVKVLKSRPRRKVLGIKPGFLLHGLSQEMGLIDAPYHSSHPSEERVRYITKYREPN